ncbi:MAG: carbohydrate-binding family 9-like protein [Bryobacteraceae bacterium]|nr:carbohydrate-binding family 9-like protein [Bryobacteraceae bacterium]MDW8379561.1 carbohydrate-binding family 9-like protein [Bryobacterales bacterium]
MVSSIWPYLGFHLLFAGSLSAASPGRLEAIYSPHELPLTADPRAPHWKDIEPVIADRDRYGKVVPSHRTEIRARWTKDNLYLLFTCPYEQLSLRPNPSTDTETNFLWLNDVAEVFVGANFQKIHQYREYQVSPQGEWVDLDINRLEPSSAHGWRWNSGFQVKARIDATRKIWYGEFKIPIRSFDDRGAQEGNEVRINFYRIQGPEPNRTYINWQPVYQETFHTPEAFGLLRFRK